ncbi:uncharacterized protein LOC127256699 [Andrographis paniculata]|uniref:uncharacterized protein LOC127256699 n=1 Tax=Andrographis paniculata TaxID=175694 RepID=UPI0021E88376|nr:uncharacterized protein LOC127256699 [Andrographis paniculata]
MATQSRADNILEPWLEPNKIVMVTGASSGLGWEFCLDLAEAGCRIIAAARRIDRLHLLCNRINEKFPVTSPTEPSQIQHRAMAMEFDIATTEKNIESCINKAWDLFGRIDVLINNAGARERLHKPLDLSQDEWDKIIRTNLTGTWLVSNYVCQHMREARQGGCVINIATLGGLNRVIFPGGDAYAASKTGVNTITKIMAKELGPYNIRVNAIAPGLFKSEITGKLMEKRELVTALSKVLPLGSFGTVNSALGPLVRYLIGESSQYVTGNVFIIDAGLSLAGVPIFSSL